jgi:hypothetical protein
VLIVQQDTTEMIHLAQIALNQENVLQDFTAQPKQPTMKCSLAPKENLELPLQLLLDLQQSMSAQVVLREVIVIEEDLQLLLLHVKMDICVVQDLFIPLVLILKNVHKETTVLQELKLHVLQVLIMLRQVLLHLLIVFHVNMDIIAQTQFPQK